jgi:hypothetical protein
MNDKGWGVAQIVEHPRSKHKALSSNPSAAKKKGRAGMSNRSSPGGYQWEREDKEREEGRTNMAVVFCIYVQK